MKYKGNGFEMWDAWYLNVNERVHAFHLKLEGNDLHSVGHVYTDDLLHFKRCEDILRPLPKEQYPEDCLGKYTGCAITDKKTGTHYIYYTMRNENRDEKIGVTLSKDLENFELYEGNPVLVPDPKIHSKNPAKKTDCRDMLIVYDEEKDIYYGYFATMIKDGKRRVGGICVCESHDLLHWENQSIAYIPEFDGVVEVPDVFFMDGKWYLTALAGNYYGTRSLVGDSNIAKCTIYAVSDDPKGPFVEPCDNVFIAGPIGSGYTCRSVMFHGERYLMYIDSSEYGAAISFPKLIKVIDGKLCPVYADILMGLRRKWIDLKKIESVSNSFAWETHDGKLTYDRRSGHAEISVGKKRFSRFISKDDAFSNVEIRFSLTANADEAGIMLDASQENDIMKRMQTSIIINTVEKHLSVYSGGFETVLAGRRRFEFECGKKYDFTVFLVEGQAEIYINDVLFLNCALKTEGDKRFGLCVGNGSAVFDDVRLYELED